MLNEYALDPNLLSNWKDFRYFIEKFGVPNGRLISRYPSTWERAVLIAISGCRDVEKKRIVERLRQVANRVLINRFHEWDDNLDWMNNAVEEHSKRPFHAIISTSNPNNHSQIIIGDSIDESEPLMQATRTVEVKRKAADMAFCFKRLLQCSKQILFIDPYFSGSSGRHLRPLCEFLKCIDRANTLYRLRVNRLEYHTNDRVEEGTFKVQCNSRLPNLIPRGLTLQIIRWKKEELHNRFILTDIGGMFLGTGLDDDDYGNSTATDSVSLLDESHYQEHWQKYSGKTSFHSIVGKR